MLPTCSFCWPPGEVYSPLAEIYHQAGAVDMRLSQKANFPTLKEMGFVLAVQADGKVIGSFSQPIPASPCPMVRINPDGSLDTSFVPQATGDPGCLLLQPDGKLLAGGGFLKTAAATGIGLVRLNADGSTVFNFIDITGQRAKRFYRVTAR